MYSQMKILGLLVLLAIGGYSHGRLDCSIECLPLRFSGSSGFIAWRCFIPSIATGRVGGCDLMVQETRIMPTLRQNKVVHSVVTLGNRVYVIGGNVNDGASDMVCYNVTSNAWENSIPLPEDLVSVAATGVDDLIYITGWSKLSQLDRSYHNKAWVYSERNGTWRELESNGMKGRVNHQMANMHGIVYVLGGDVTGKSVERYDPQHGFWRRVAPMFEGREYFGCVALSPYIYAIGGQNATGLLSSVERYHTLDNEWHYMSEMPTTRYQFGAVESGGWLYCIGGRNSLHELNTVIKFHPATNRWHCEVAPLMVTKYALAASCVRVPLLDPLPI